MARALIIAGFGTALCKIWNRRFAVTARRRRPQNEILGDAGAGRAGRCDPQGIKEKWRWTLKSTAGVRVVKVECVEEYQQMTMGTAK